MNTCKGQITIIKGPEPNTQYTLVVSPDSITRKSNGSFTNSSVTCTVYKQVNGGTATICDDASVCLTYTVNNKEYYFWGHNNTEPSIDMKEYYQYDTIEIKLYTSPTPNDAVLKQKVTGSILLSFDNPIAIHTISFISDGKEDANFEIWIGEDGNNNPNDVSNIWDDGDENHIDDYYVSSDGTYWVFDGTAWNPVTDKVLGNILSRVDGNVAKYIVNVGEESEYFANINYKIGDIMLVKDSSLSGHGNLYLCIENKNGNFSYEDWTDGLNIKERMYDAGIDISKNAIDITADKIHLNNQAGERVADLCTVTGDEVYINTNLLKIDGKVVFEGNNSSLTDIITSLVPDVPEGGNYPGDPHITGLIKSTTIDGSKIETGTITADKIVTGTFDVTSAKIQNAIVSEGLSVGDNFKVSTDGSVDMKKGTVYGTVIANNESSDKTIRIDPNEGSVGMWVQHDIWGNPDETQDQKLVELYLKQSDAGSDYYSGNIYLSETSSTGQKGYSSVNISPTLLSFNANRDGSITITRTGIIISGSSGTTIIGPGYIELTNTATGSTKMITADS